MSYKEFLESLKKRLAVAVENDDSEEILQVMSLIDNPKYQIEEYYQQEKFTGYASIDKPHQKFFKKGTMEVEMPKMKMYDFLYERLKNYPNFKALNFYGRRITFDEMFYNIEECAKSFLETGVKRGDYVVISMPTTPEAVYMLFALNRIGAVAVELDPRTTKEDIEITLRESKTKFYITMEDCSVMIDDLLKENDALNNQVENVMFISPTESLPFGLNFVSDLKDNIDRIKGTKVRVPNNTKYINWHDFIKKGRSYQGIIDSNYVSNEVCEIIYSSGTTNRPKPIQYTNETFTSMVRQVELGENDYAPRDKNLDIIPIYLGFGSNNALYTVLCFGIEDILIPVPVTDNLPKLIEKYKPNHILGAPIHMNILLKYLQDSKNLPDLSYLKSLVSGSAYLESSKQYALDDELARRGCKIKVGPGYGQNEAGPGLCLSTDSLLEKKKVGCSGYPLSHIMVSIFNPETDEELMYGQDLEGEIRYKTPCSMKGYAFDRESENSKFFKKGYDEEIWCCSGDLGKIDNDGCVYITGRITRQIGRNGFKFSPTEIEELVISNVKAVESCTVVSRPDEFEENVPILYYTLKPNLAEMALIVEEEIKTICSSLKEYKIPVEYICIDKMPMTQNLKVDFKALERKALLEKEKVFVKKLTNKQF